MKSILNLLVIIITNISTLSSGENPATQWGKQINFALEALSVTGDNSGNCFIAGTTTDSLSPAYAGKKDVFVRKYDPSGNILWTLNFGSKEDDYCYAIIADNDGNCIIAGKTAGSLARQNLGKDDAFVIKISPSGNLIWEKQFGTPQADDCTNIIIDCKGNYIICGSTYGSFEGSSAGGSDAVMLKMNSAGKIIWRRQYGTTADEKAQFTASDKNDSYYFILSSNELIIYNRQAYFVSKKKCEISITKRNCD
jgi:hypothetical protein